MMIRAATPKREQPSIKAASSSSLGNSSMILGGGV